MMRQRQRSRSGVAGVSHNARPNSRRAAFQRELRPGRSVFRSTGLAGVAAADVSEDRGYRGWTAASMFCCVLPTTGGWPCPGSPCRPQHGRGWFNVQHDGFSTCSGGPGSTGSRPSLVCSEAVRTSGRAAQLDSPHLREHHGRRRHRPRHRRPTVATPPQRSCTVFGIITWVLYCLLPIKWQLYDDFDAIVSRVNGQFLARPRGRTGHVPRGRRLSSCWLSPFR